MTLLALVAPFGACVTQGREEHAPVPPSGYNFAYLAPQGDALGLIQAFDDGAHTYLELDGRASHLSIRADAASSPLPFAAGERYITLVGVYPHLVLTDDRSSTTIVNEAARPATPSIDQPVYKRSTLNADNRVTDSAGSSGDIATVGVPESEQTMNATLRVGELNREIGNLEQRIRTLSDQLATSQQNVDTASLAIRPEFKVPRIVVRFADNSDEAHIEGPLLDLLGAAARAANRIYLHGHTDAFVASDAGTQLAIRRAISVRRLLVAEQVSPARMRLFYRGAGNFLANNSTSEGKAQNRRVEIELRKW